MLYGIPQISTTVVVGKIRFLFFHLKTHFQSVFDQKHLENTLMTLLNQSMISRNAKHPPQNSKSIQNKKSFQVQICFLGTFKVKKNLIWTHIIIWNYLTQKLIVLVVGIVTKDNFALYTGIWWVFLFSSTKK